MNAPTTASETLRFLHCGLLNESLYLHLLRIDPAGKLQAKAIRFIDLNNEFDDEIERLKDGWNQFISVHAFDDANARRTNDSVAVIDTMFLDIDIAAQNKPCPATAEDALSFLLDDLPFTPTLINSSGRGLHALYSLDRAIRITDEPTRAKATALLAAFQEAVNHIAKTKHRWTFDGVADLARVHRIPFSLNLKHGDASECRPIWIGDRVTLATVENFAATAPKRIAPVAPDVSQASKSSTALAMLRRAEMKWLADRKNNPASTNAASIHAGCAFMRHALDDAATLPEPRWHAAINLLSRCEDGCTLAHAFSEEHPNYNRRETEAKFDHASGSPPVGCQHISETLGFDGCRGCPFAGRITSPIELGARTTALTELLANTVYVGNLGAFVDLRNLDSDPLTPEKFKRFHAGPTLEGSADDLFLKDRLATKANERVWRPDVGERLFREGQKTLLNTYLAPEHATHPSDPRRFFDHLDYLIPNADEREVFIDYLAHLVQRPASKLTYGMTLVSPQGSGKTYIHEVMSRVLGKANVKAINGRSLDDRFRRHMAGRVLLVMEEVSMDDRSKTYEGLKALISNETDEFEAKYLPMETIQTPRGVMVLTNHSHALYLAKDDRRFFVIQCSGPHPDGPAYYKPLFDDLESSEFIAGVWAALKARDIAAFNSKRPPFVTAAKREMIENSRSELEVRIEELMQGHLPPFDRDLATWDELLAAVRDHCRDDPSLSPKRIRRALYDHGLVLDPQGRQCAVDGRRVKLYMRDPAQFASLTAAQLASEYKKQKECRGTQNIYLVGDGLMIAANN